MAIKFEKLKSGETYFQRVRRKMGNTTISSLDEFTVRIISIDNVKRTALVSWNGNPESLWSERNLCSLYSWSMYGPDVVRSKGMLGQTTKVRRVKSARSAQEGK